MEQALMAQLARPFVLAGNATFTLRSTKTGARFTYKVRASRSSTPDKPLYFVGLLSGPQNDSDYRYIGFISDGRFMHSAKSRVTKDAPSFLAFSWWFARLMAGEDTSAVEVFHAGSCGRCGRTLTVPESIALGIGPECLGKL
jgi:hypothetical protein